MSVSINPFLAVKNSGVLTAAIMQVSGAILGVSIRPLSCATRDLEYLRRTITQNPDLCPFKAYKHSECHSDKHKSSKTCIHSYELGTKGRRVNKIGYLSCRRLLNRIMIQ